MEQVLTTAGSMEEAEKLAVPYRAKAKRMNLPDNCIQVGKVGPGGRYDSESWGVWLVIPDPG